MRNKMITAGVLAAMMLTGGSFRGYASSPVVGPGVSAPSTQNTGPGAIRLEPENPIEIPGRVDYFTEPVVNPVVTVVEKYSYDQMSQDLQKLEARYGSLMKTSVIGTSLDGRNIYEVVLGNPDAEKHILIHGGIHAREYMTPLLLMKQLEYGLEFYAKGSYEDQPLSNILHHVAVHYVPMVNPDGISLSQFGIGIIRSAELKQSIEQCYADDLAQGRTSAAFDQYLIYWKANARGVDLNQNFPADWEQVVSCPNPSYATFRGESPLSEPESQTLANLMNARDWAATISYHSMGNVIYWDYAGNRVQQQSGELATVVAASTGYRPAGSSGHGGFKDWTQIKDNPVPGLTLEVGGVACPLPLSEYNEAWYRNKMVWAAVAKYVMGH